MCHFLTEDLWCTQCTCFNVVPPSLAYHRIHVQHTLVKKVPNLAPAKNFPVTTLDTFCHFWFEIHCCKYDNKAWFTTSLSGLYNYRFGFQTFKASLILDARCARGSHELPYFDASFICTQPGLKQQTFSRRETENLPKGLKE